jgi:hypothetical protein
VGDSVQINFNAIRLHATRIPPLVPCAGREMKSAKSLPSKDATSQLEMAASLVSWIQTSIGRQPSTTMRRLSRLFLSLRLLIFHTKIFDLSIGTNQNKWPNSGQFTRLKPVLQLPQCNLQAFPCLGVSPEPSHDRWTGACWRKSWRCPGCTAKELL